VLRVIGALRRVGRVPARTAVAAAPAVHRISLDLLMSALVSVLAVALVLLWRRPASGDERG
jgi:hypothetical protein